MDKRLRASYFLAYVAYALCYLFIPLFGKDLGLSLFEIGLAGTAFGLGSFLSYYAFGRWSDISGRRDTFIKAGLLASSLAFLAQLFITDFYSMAVIRFFAGLAVGIFSFPLMAAASRHEKARKSLSGISAWGSFGWFFGGIIFAFLAGSGQIFTASALFFFLAFIVSLFLPEIGSQKMSVPKFPKQLLKKNWPVYLTFLVRHTSANSVWVVYPLFFKSLGASNFWLGIIWAVNPLTQFILMHAIGGYAEKHSTDSRKLIKAGTIATAIAFLALGFVSDYFHIIPIQMIIAASFSLLFVGCLINLSENNAEKATATGLLGSIQSLALIIGPLLGGAIAQAFGMQSVFLFAAAGSVVSLVIAEKISPEIKTG
ncbi:MAG: MFS transporter [Candidatus Diapherotrites archaeon]|nr:MFS transporter [Candidatus Diapherotrites archaeon]